MPSIGYISGTLPRGVRKGMFFARKTWVIEASGSNHHRVVAHCLTATIAKEVAEGMNRKARRYRRSKR